ncbi:hypothetical protein [Flavisphingomonas formosensis]|uniref:hypothetical protein n=1 Tax=Flavisphingomonas formosensis TaxID=861534 RepID=UPI0012F76BDD|nr:hypothetical protein [Sphingomonas formosensis]
MNTEAEEMALPRDDVNITGKTERPRASQWLWRPWYAKLWWAGAALYWTGKIGSYWSPIVDNFYTTALAGYLNVLFYPLTALMVLGVGFIHAWMDYRGLEWEPPADEQQFSKRSVGGFRDPIADPLDPRSPSHWRYLDDIK